MPRGAASPGSEVYEPLTPKNDESPSLCGIGIGGPCATAVGETEAEDMDDGTRKKTTLQVSQESTSPPSSFTQKNAFIKQTQFLIIFDNRYDSYITLSLL